MPKGFKIDFDDFGKNNSNSFSVISASVEPPYPFFCKSGERAFSRLFYVCGGQIIFNKNTSKTICASKGDIVYLPSCVEYRSEWSNDEKGSYISIQFVHSDFCVILPDEICIAASDSAEIYLEYFKYALDTWTHGSIGYKFEVMSVIYKIFCHLFINVTHKNIRETHNNIHKGIIYLENHYIDNIDAAYLARLCNLSESCFRRYFKKYKGMSPIRYRNYLRMKKAYEMIQSREYSITEAAANVNVPDLCYFNRMFKEFFGTTPGKIK